MDEKKFQEAFAALVKDKHEREALAQIIVEYVQPQHLTEEFTSRLLTTRRLSPGDALVKKIRKGIEVRTLVPGSVHLASEITVKDIMNYVLDGADVKVNYNAWTLESGEIGSVQEIRAEMAAKLRDFYINKLFTYLSTVWSAANTPNNYVSAGGVITDTVLEAGINRINQTAGGVKTVLGLRSVMTPITKFGAFWNDGTHYEAVPSSLEEIKQSGVLGKYYGAPLLSIDQIYNNPDDYEGLFPSNKILIIGQNVGEFILYGDVYTKQWEDMNPTPPMWNLELYQQYGLIIDNAQGIYVIDNVTAS